MISSGHDIVYISLSSALSSTYQNALLAAGEFPEGRVHVVDSETLCGGIALLVMKAARAAAAGESAANIAAMITEARNRVESEFVVDTLDYLYMGGRCSGMQNFIGSLLKIRPVLRLVDGAIVPRCPHPRQEGEGRGTDAPPCAGECRRYGQGAAHYCPYAGRRGCQDAGDQLRAQTDVKEIAVIHAGCVIGSHCGPATVGLMYMR